ncbi:MAG TPA: 50S ribosomal protein L7ae [Firmicutes bacterium]|nr:50S ribosomal protein L7ae [Bacillota bacterium]
MGLARKAGRLQVGEQACRQALSKGQAELIILAGDSSERTQRVFRRLGGEFRVPVCLFTLKAELGRRLGRDQVAVAVVTDAALARAVYQATSGAGAEKTRG